MGSMDKKTETIDSTNKTLTACDVEALKKCLEDNNGDYMKCKAQIEAFKSSCALKKPTQSVDSPQKLNNGVF